MDARWIVARFEILGMLGSVVDVCGCDWSIDIVLPNPGPFISSKVSSSNTSVDDMNIMCAIIALQCMVVDGCEGSLGVGLPDPWLDYVEEQPAKKQLDGDNRYSVVSMDAGGCVAHTVWEYSCCVAHFQCCMRIGLFVANT